jgi:hypothetical protein
MLVDRGHDHGESLLQFDPGLGLKKKVWTKIVKLEFVNWM